MKRIIAALFLACIAAAPALAVDVNIVGSTYNVTVDSTTYRITVANGIAYPNTQVYNVVAYGAKGDSTTDDTGAIQSAIDAALLDDGGIVFFPQGFYLTSDTLEIDGDDIVLQGVGGEASVVFNSSTVVLSISSEGAYADNIAIRDLGLRSDIGGGHVIDVPYGGGGWEISRCYLTQRNKGSSIFSLVRTAVTGGIYFGRFNDGRWMHTDSSTVPAVNIVGDTGSYGNVCSDNVWEGIRIYYSGAYFFHIEANIASVWNYNNHIRNIEAEICNGGIVKALGVNVFTVENCAMFDNGTDSIYNSNYFFALADSGTAQNRGITVRNILRTGGILKSGVYDVELSGTNKSPGTILENIQGTGVASTDPQIQLGANEYVLMMGDWSRATITGFPTDRSVRIETSGAVTADTLTLFSGASIGGVSYPGNVANSTEDDATPNVTGLVEIGLTPGSADSVRVLDFDDGTDHTNIPNGMLLVVRGRGGANGAWIHDGGNFNLSADFTPGDNDILLLIYIAQVDAWLEVGRSNN